MADKIVVLHSGGLDSTVCLHQAIATGSEVISLGIDYGQRHRIELEYANRQCQQLDIERKVIKIEWTKPIREIPKDRDVKEMSHSISPAFLPGRNALFFMTACAEAAGIVAKEVWTGINSVDFSGYPDCTPEFVDSFRNMLNNAIPNGPQLITPLQFKTKPEIAKVAHKLGIRKGDTWSCYTPHYHEQGISPCGRCDACRLHNHAWHAAGF